MPHPLHGLTGHRPSRLAAWAVLIPALVAAALAQRVTATLATGLVVDVALGGAAEQNLDFTRMHPGTAKSVAAQNVQSCPDACTAGRWRFQNINVRASVYDRATNLSLG